MLGSALDFVSIDLGFEYYPSPGLHLFILVCIILSLELHPF